MILRKIMRKGNSLLIKFFRVNTKRGQKDRKAEEQAEYRRLFEQNSQRELANEAAYKKRFEDFDNTINK